MALLDTYRVGVDGPWTAREAAHLFRRAGFGAPTATCVAAAGDGSQQAFEAVVNSQVDVQADDPNLDGPDQGLGWGGPLAGLPDDDSPEGRTRNPHTFFWMQAHFAYRLRYTAQPFQEQFALFLHDHFVSQFRKVRQGVNRGQRDCGDVQQLTVDLMLNQLALHRRQGLDRFRDTLLAVTRNPSMLFYLDNYANTADGAQENYAREMMELFSMGVGNYIEADVREVAKGLTGETLPRLRNCGAADALTYGFKRSDHASGDKRVFEQTVPFSDSGKETEDIINLILAHRSQQPDVSGQPAPYDTLPAAAVYLAWKLLTWFVNQDIGLDPPAPAVLELADYLRGSDGQPYPARRYPYDLRAALGKVFRSRFFYAPENRFAIVKTPADFVMGSLNLLELDYEYKRRANHPAHHMAGMGMELFNPTNVSGWAHGRAWINAESLIARYNWADRLSQALLTNDYVDALKIGQGGPLDPEDHAAIAAYLEDQLVQDDLEAWAPGARARLVAFMDGVEAGEGNANQRFREKVRGGVWLILSMPLWQMK